MKYKINFILPISLFLLITSMLILVNMFQSCNKEISNKGDFNIEIAKEWWYSKFKKSSEYNENNDKDSPFSPNEGLSSKKYPKWKSALYYRLNELEIVEVPLVYETNFIVLPKLGNLKNTIDGERIAKATLHKLLIIRSKNKKINVRVVTMVPEKKYLENHGYNINNKTFREVQKEFEGVVFVKKWNEFNINAYKVGFNKCRIINLKKSISIVNKGTSQNCNWVEVPIYVWVCVVVPSGDDIADEERCRENGHWVQTSTTWEYDCVEVDEDQILDECLEGLGNSQYCNCLILGLDCSVDDSQDSNAEILNNVTDSCIHNSVQEAISNDCKNVVSSYINTTFQNNDAFVLRFFDANFSSQLASVDATTSINNSNINSSNIFITIRFNKLQLADASKEYIAATILHEAVHAWIYFKYSDPIQNENQHNMIASSSYFNYLKSALLEMCPNLSEQDAYDLTWGGLYNTIGFSALPPSVRQRIIETNNNFKFRSSVNGKGTHC